MEQIQVYLYPLFFNLRQFLDTIRTPVTLYSNSATLSNGFISAWFKQEHSVAIGKASFPFTSQRQYFYQPRMPPAGVRSLCLYP